MSIHPEYAEALLDGMKTVELRKSGVADDVSHIVIYATAPVRRVLGWVEAVRVEHGSPSAIWRKHRARTGCASGSSAGTTVDIVGRSRSTSIRLGVGMSRSSSRPSRKA